MRTRVSLWLAESPGLVPERMGTGQTMMRYARLSMGAGALLAVMAMAWPVQAGDDNGNVMVRVLGAVIVPDDVKSISSNGVVVPNADADVSTQVIPALTLTYFVTNNWALELLCCVSKHQVDGKGPVLGGNGELAETWIFPPIVTLQYHFDHMGAFKPYVGAGVQYIHFFSEGLGGNNGLGATSVDFDDAWGFALQGGLDVSLGDGWYLNADVKKVWLNTDVTWQNAAGGLGTVVADVDLNPWIISAGIGYRFNLEDLLGRREAVPLK